MTPDRWLRLKELFEAALELDAERRPEFLDTACLGDSELRAEIDGLLSAHRQATNLLPTESLTAVRAPAYPDGTVLVNRFRINRFLGRGGMGEVYEAWDQVVLQNVAVKTILPDISRNLVAVARLRQEIQNARRVTHPHVCRVFDLIQDTRPDGDSFLLTMELIAGETLAARLRRTGALPWQEALALVKQLAMALDAAHQAGVIHRDFKPGNIMLEPVASGGVRAVVTDFGLAQSVVTPNLVVTESRLLVGTPAYMAPEQLAGGDATAASDIYAFGIVLCEIFTGTRPGTDGQIKTAGLAGQRWEKVIRRCIERSPEKRFPSAAEAVAAVAGRSLLPYLTRRGQFALAAIVALALLITIAVIRRTLAKPVPQPGVTLLLSDISNLTPDNDISAATEIFRTQLQQSAYLNVWDRRRLAAIFQKMGRASGGPLNAVLAREVAFREGVPLVVSATVAPVGDQFTVSVLLEALEPGSPNVRTRWSQSFPAAGKDQLLDAIHEACVWLRRKVGEQQADIVAHDRPPEDVTTTSWQALARYWEAEQFQAARQSDKAIQMLKVAVTFDPHFALGYMRLGDILMATRQEDQGIHYWRQALAEAGRGHLTRHEELRLTGLYDADTWDWAGYEASFAQMEKEFPYDWLASFYLGDAYRNRGRLPEAIQAFERARLKTKDSIPLADNLGTVAMEMNDAARLRRETERLARLGHPEFGDQIEGEAKFAAADFAGALDIFRRVEGAGNPESASRATWFEAAALAETGSVPAAEDILKKGIAKDTERGLPEAEISKRLALGYLALLRGDHTAARAWMKSALPVVKSPYQATSVAILAARLQETAIATDLVKRVEQAAPGTALASLTGARIKGEILLSAGRFAAALPLLRQWSALANAETPRWCLARALEGAGRLDEASSVYAAAADIRKNIASAPESVYPGFFSQTLLDYARCARAAGMIHEAEAAMQEYHRRRQNPNPPRKENHT